MDWEARYQEDNTPWDLNGPPPSLTDLTAAQPTLFAGKKILVPGCGKGHDALHLAKFSDQVTGLDLAPEALAKAKKLDQAQKVNWMTGDFLAGDPGSEFEIIWEHTCFCAIPLSRRRDYVAATAKLLPPGGRLVGVFFMNPPVALKEGPPFGTSQTELEDLFGPHFFLEEMNPEPKSVEERAGREMVFCWQRR